MNGLLQAARMLFAIGLMGLGVLAVIYRDFALDWQPVANWVPGHAAFAYHSGLLMLACAIGMLFRSTGLWSVRILFPYLIAWVFLKVPLLFAAPGMEGVWLGFGEIVVLMTGGWILWAVSENVAPDSLLGTIAGAQGVQRALVGFGLAVLPVGLSHLVYIPETVRFVPRWLPDRTF
jgi:hypothetical protein